MAGLFPPVVAVEAGVFVGLFESFPPPPPFVVVVDDVDPASCTSRLFFFFLRSARELVRDGRKSSEEGREMFRGRGE